MSDFERQIKWYLDMGCIDYSKRLGFVSIPDGYALLLNSDHSHFFYIKDNVEDESCIHWDKWAVYRWIKTDEKDNYYEWENIREI